MSIIFVFVSFFAAVIPMVVYLLILWWLDRNEREPFWVMILNFFWGATGAIILGVIGSIIFQTSLSGLINSITDGNSADMEKLTGAIITAPVVEEFTKGIFLLIMSLRRGFDGVVDGIVCGGAIGLGFGMTENFMYFVSSGENWIMLVIVRTLFSAVMHGLAQATFGGFVGLAKFKPIGLKFFLIPFGYFCAVLLHFAWNLSVSFEDTTLLGLVFVILYFAGFFALFQIALFFESKTILFELSEEAKTGIILEEHLRFIPYSTRRNRSGWCPPFIDKKYYINTAITLAFRKHQYRLISEKQKLLYYNEIQNLRNKIYQIFQNAKFYK